MTMTMTNPIYTHKLRTVCPQSRDSITGRVFCTQRILRPCLVTSVPCTSRACALEMHPSARTQRDVMYLHTHTPNCRTLNPPRLNVDSRSNERGKSKEGEAWLGRARARVQRGGRNPPDSAVTPCRINLRHSVYNVSYSARVGGRISSIFQKVDGSCVPGLVIRSMRDFNFLHLNFRKNKYFHIHLII